MVVNSNIRYKGRKQFCDIETGEIEEVDVFEKKVGRNEPFMITYMQEILSLMEVLGNRKMKVVKYILKTMNKSNNTLLITTEELAKKTNVSRQTVSDTLKILTDVGIIKRRIGAIMINPKLMNNKKPKQEATMIIRFQEFDN